MIEERGEPIELAKLIEITKEDASFLQASMQTFTGKFNHDYKINIESGVMSNLPVVTEEMKQGFDELGKVDADLLQAYSQAVHERMGNFSSLIQDFFLKDLAQEAELDYQRMEIPEIARVIVTPTDVEIYTFDDFLYLVSRDDQKVKKMKLIDGEMVAEEIELSSNTATQQHSNTVIR